MRVITFILLGVLLLSSCKTNSSLGKTEKGNGDIVVKEINIGTFSMIETSVAANIIYEQKGFDAPYCRIEIDKNLRDFISVKDSRGKLQIKTTKRISPTKFNIYVQSADLKAIDYTGSGSIWLKGKTKVDELTINLTGSGDMQADNIECSFLGTNLKGSGNIIVKNASCLFLKTKITGSGDILLKKGHTNYAEVEANGSGDFDAQNFKIKSLTCMLKGSGDISPIVTESLAVNLLGSGNVKYKGNPIHVNKNIKGTGLVKASK